MARFWIQCLGHSPKKPRQIFRRPTPAASLANVAEVQMKHFLLGVLVTLVVLFLGVYFYLILGSPRCAPTFLPRALKLT